MSHRCEKMPDNVVFNEEIDNGSFFKKLYEKCNGWDSRGFLIADKINRVKYLELFLNSYKGLIQQVPL